MTNLIATMLVGPKEKGLERALESLKKVKADAIHVLVDTLDSRSWKLLAKYDCKIFNREWNWEFGPSREFLQQTIPADTKWQIWLDTDDEIPDDTADKIKEIVEKEDSALYSLPYSYVKDDVGQGMILYRVRLFPPTGVHWHMRAHEYATHLPGLKKITRSDMPILHHWEANAEGHAEKCVQALQLDLKDMPNDTRVMYYLAQSLQDTNNPEEAIEMYQKYLDTGGWDEERMCACIQLSYLYQRSDLDFALKYALQAVDEVKGQRREACQRVAEIYTAKEDWQSAYDWLNKELELPFPKDGTLYVQSDHYRQLPHQWMIIPCDNLNKIEEGLKHAQRTLEYMPGDVSAKRNESWFKHRLLKEKMLKLHVQDNSKPTAFFHVGLSAEKWTSDSVNTKGIGGRETSNICMAKEFQKLGWNVILFADCEGMDGDYDGLLNLDYTLFYDMCEIGKPDVVFISLRTSIVDRDFPARLKVMWVHDISFGNNLEDWPDYLTEERKGKFDKFFFMSQSQKDYIVPKYHISENKCYLSRSGILIDRFSSETTIERDRYRLIYTSSPDRGLERLLDFFGEIKERVPQATLDIYYGFQSTKGCAKSRSEEKLNKAEVWIAQLVDKIERADGVTLHDRIPQDQLALEFQKSTIWAYPTHFWETMCLSALEASAAGCAVVTTRLAALETTVGEYGILIDGDPDSQEYRQTFIKAVVSLLTDDEHWKQQSELAKKNIYERVNDSGIPYWDWKAIAQEWDCLLRSELGVRSPNFQSMDDSEAFDYLKCKFVDYMQYRQEILTFMDSVRRSLGTKLDVIVEIGCGYGANLCMLSRLLSEDGVIIGIDPQSSKTYYIESSEIESLIPTEKWEIIDKSSQDEDVMEELTSLLNGRKIDLAFIDGEHSYGSVHHDWRMLRPLMERRSAMAFHDIAAVGGCTQAFYEAREHHKHETISNVSNDFGIGVVHLDSDSVIHNKTNKKRKGVDNLVIGNDKDVTDSLETLWQETQSGETVVVETNNLYSCVNNYLTCKTNTYELLDSIYLQGGQTHATLRSSLARVGFQVLSVVHKDNKIIASAKKPTKYGRDWICSLAAEKFKQDVLYPKSLYDNYKNSILLSECERFIENEVDSPELSIIVIAHKQKDERTIPCIENIRRFAGDIKYELIGVDDGSKDGTSEYFQSHVDKTVVLSPRQGICLADNAGIKMSKAPYVCIIQNDADIGDGFLEKLFEGIIREHRVGMVSGWLNDVRYNYEGDTDIKDGFCILPQFVRNNGKQNWAWDVFVPGPCRIYSRQVLAKMGMFDPFIYNNWEDHDSMLAVQSLGYDVGILLEPRFNLFPTESMLQNPALYTTEQHIRRFLSVYYFHLKWNYEIREDWMLSVEV